MATAIIRGMLRAGVCTASDITVACPEKVLLEVLRDSTGVKIAADNASAVADAEVVVLCVKPNDVAAALAEAGDVMAGKLLLSIAAGQKIAFLESCASQARVIRAMPNTAAMVGCSPTAFACGASVTDADREVANKVFSGIGSVHPVAEGLLDAVTGLSGSGPAYVCLMIEALSDGGVACGLPRTLATELAVATVRGTAEMVQATSEHPATLREMVTSPGGTTIAGLHVLETRAVRGAFMEAVRAATARSCELSAS